MIKADSENKKKIVLVSDLNFRYQANHPLDLAEVFAASGFDVSIIAPVAEDVAHLHAGRGYKIICLPVVTGRLSLIRFILETLYCVIRIRPDLIIGVNQAGYIPAYLASRLIPCPLIYYAMELSRLPEGDQGFCTRFQAKFAHSADMVWSTGIERARVMQEDWHLDEIPYVLPNTLVTPKQRNAQGHLRNLMRNYQPDDKIVLYASGLSAKTAIPQLIKSVKFWRAGIKLAIIGFGPDVFLGQIRQQIEHLNLGKQIEYLGSFPSKLDVFRLLPDADLGIVLRNHRNAPDLNTVYYTPGKLLEYAAFGVPVICSDNLSLLFVEREGWGIGVDPDNPEAIAQAVNSLIQHPEQLKRMGQIASQRFTNEYCMEVQGRQLVQILQNKGLL